MLEEGGVAIGLKIVQPNNCIKRDGLLLPFNFRVGFLTESNSFARQGIKRVRSAGKTVRLAGSSK